ncbi:DUF1178 family protein [Ovoidimarina sediminis]|uniref:DUF1178 family protein n=1 Tax=Ovoidimarina sediminis TaxID=3079856 RepID=UPI00290BC80D|nr:DUF1178 family protein [Rhodophyticola sp. MJ-SS7]MDU8944731.1 DUF1178 family protein [Rhodophyticola sp. MJ-SS7]
MIRYTLRCANDHRFDSWFQSAEGYDALKAAGHVMCPACGTGDVDKALMAPRVRPARKSAESAGSAEISSDGKKPDLRTPEDDRARALAELRNQIEQNSDYVGLNFTKEARAMHSGEKPLRAIYGEAKTEDAKKLIEDGVPVAPLPFTPKARTN